MIYTASFFEPKHFGDGKLVSIAMEIPENFMITHPEREVVLNELLQPRWGMVGSRRAGIINTKTYGKQYFLILREKIGRVDWYDLQNGKMGAEETLRTLVLQDGDTIVCWEKYGQFCRRILIAGLLEKNGVIVRRR